MPKAYNFLKIKEQFSYPVFKNTNFKWLSSVIAIVKRITLMLEIIVVIYTASAHTSFIKDNEAINVWTRSKSPFFF